MSDTIRNEPSNMDTLLTGLWKENPVFVQVLGMCPTLAVTNSVINSLVMGLATTFVLILSSAIISALKNIIPKQVRIATYILIIATFVTVADYLIQAVSLEVYKALGAFIALIVVNCIILGRAEGVASKHGVWKSMLDAAGMGFGFTFALLCLGVVREVIGNGTFLGYPVFGQGYEPWVVMILPGGAFFVLGAWLILFNWMRERRKREAAAQSDKSRELVAA